MHTGTKHILFVVSGPTLGGAERQLCYFLEKYDRTRLACSVLTVLSPTSKRCKGKNDFRPILKAIGIPVHSLNLDRFPTSTGLFALTKEIRKVAPDIVQSYGLAVDFAIRNLPLGRIARIGSMRGTEDHRSSLTFLLDGLTSRFQLTGYISNSFAAKQALINRGLARAEKICVIPNGIDCSPFKAPALAAARLTTRSSLAIHENETVVTCIANIYPQKGHAYLLQAIQTLSRSFPLRVLLIGEDRTNGALNSLLNRFSLHKYVLNLGTRNDIPELLAASDIFTLPSLQEGMPNAILEAMSAGLPIIGTAVGDVTKMLDNGRCGTVVQKANAGQLANAIGRYIRDPAYAQRHGQLARDRATHCYSLDRMVDAHEQFYKGIGHNQPNCFTQLTTS